MKKILRMVVITLLCQGGVLLAGSADAAPAKKKGPDDAGAVRFTVPVSTPNANAVIPSSTKMQTTKTGAPETAAPADTAAPLPVEKKAVAKTAPAPAVPAVEEKNTVVAPVKKEKQAAPVAAVPPVQDQKNRARSEDALRDAYEFYRYGEFDEAAEYVEKAVDFDPSHAAAQAMQEKILTLRRKIEEIKHDLSEQCYYRAVNAQAGNNMLESLLLSQQAQQFNPDSTKANDLFIKVVSETQQYVRAMSASDIKKFSKAIKKFLDEDFAGAAIAFRRLQRYYPEITDFLAVAESHASDMRNMRRSHEYFQTAIKEIAAERFSKARENLYLALEMDKLNIDARIRLAQVSLELGEQRTSAVGQE